MKRSNQPTEYILLRAKTNSEWDCCEFALIHLTPEWVEEIYKRLRLIEPFKNDLYFCSHTYWDVPVGFYNNNADLDESFTDTLLKQEEDWAFVLLESDEPDDLSIPISPLDTHQFIISKDGTGKYKAYGKQSGEAYWTEEFNVVDLLNLTLNRTS